LQSKRLAFECLEERRVLAVQAFPLPLESVAPDGALIYQGTATATIDDSAEVESFTIDLDAGQSISLLVTPNESLEAELVLHTPGGFSTGIFGPGAPGEPVLLNDFQITQAGTYTFDVSGEPGLNGAFDLRLVVGAALEAETVTGDSNDTVVAAQPIAIGEVMSGSGRGAVLGQLASGTTDDDWYAFDLDDGAAATIVLDSATPGAATLELYHSDGTTLVALGTADSDSQQAIRGFADATSDTLPDTYFLRVSGADTDYRLVMTTNLDFEAEANDALETAQDVSRLGSVLAHAALGNDDFYQFSVEVDDELAITTLTPGDGEFVPVNLLDPQIEIFDPTGTPISHLNAIGNESFSHTALASGVYTVRVFSELNSGNYVLTITGATGTDAPFEVAATNLVDGTLLSAPPAQVEIDFSDTVLADSIDVTDLEITGLVTGAVSADSVTQLDGNTVVFTLPALDDDVYTLSIATGAVVDLDGQSLEEFTIALEVDQTAPRVTSSTIAEGEVVDASEVTIVTLGFDELLADADLDVTDVVLMGLVSGAQVATSLTYDDQSQTVAIEFTVLPVDTYTLTITSGDGAFEDLAGNDLDGEPGVFPTGNDSPGGNFVLNFELDAPFTATAVAPVDGAVLPTAPTQLTIDFNDTVFLDSIEAADLVITVGLGGPVPANAVTQVDDDTFIFDLPVLAEGEYVLTIVAGAITDVDGQTLEAFEMALEVDETSPRITSASVLAGQIIKTNNPTFEFGFNDALDGAALDVADVTLVGLESGAHVATDITYDEQLQTVSIEFAALPEDSFTLTLISGDGAFEDLAGNDLDGEAGAFPSGNNSPGGDYVVSFIADPLEPIPLELARLDPLGSLVFAGQVDGEIDILGDIDRFSFFVAQGEMVTAVVVPDDPLAILSLELEGLSSPIVAQGPGRAIVIPPELITEPEYLTLRVKGNRTTTYSLDVVINATVEQLVTVANAGGTLSLEPSLLDLPAGERLAVIGSSTPQTMLVGELADEPNDDFSTAVFSGIGLGTGVDAFTSSGEIGDNPSFAPGLDVDFVQIQLDVGERVLIDIDAADIGSTLDSLLALFDSSGQVVALNDDFGSLDSLIDFTATHRDTYYVGISGFANQNYDPFRAGSGFAGSIGTYDLSIERITEGSLGAVAVEAEIGEEFSLPDIDSYSFELAGLGSKTVDVLIIGKDGSSFSDGILELIGPDGFTVLVTAVADPLGAPATNVDLAILSFLVPTDGQYTARLTSHTAGDYVLLVGRGLSFAIEPNDDESDPLRPLLGNTPTIGYLEGPPATGGGQGSTVEEFVETEPNDAIATANPMPLGFDNDEHTEIEVLGELTTGNSDFYSVALQPGDVFVASLSGAGSRVSIRDALGNELMGSSQNVNFIYPDSSPLISDGHAVASLVTGLAGQYFVEVSGAAGEYSLELRVARPGIESQEIGNRQRLFLDFDGATVDRSIVGQTGLAILSPLIDFLPGWGLTVGDLDLVIDAIVATVIENLSSDTVAFGINGDHATSGIPGEFDIEILNSRDHADPFGEPNVTRLVVGGTIAQLGQSLLGIAESIDPGNFDTEETGVVLLDLLSGAASSNNSLNKYQRDPSVSIIDLIGVGVGNIVSHEFGHLLGVFHTDQFNSVPIISDQGGSLDNFVGLVGAIWGDGDEIDVDFGSDNFVLNEGFTGVQDSRHLIAFGLSTGTINPALVGPTVVSVTPPIGISGDVITAITIEFSEAISEETALDPANYTLIEAGPNGVFENGAGDDIVVPVTILFDGLTGVELTIDPSFAPLGFGRYQLTIDGDSSIEDVDGNPLGSTTGPGGGRDFVHQFEVLVIEPGGDLFEITLTTEQPATFATVTPFDIEVGDRINDLDPLIVVYDANGTPLAIDRDSRDGKNAQLVFHAPANGSYLVQVLAQSGAGEYQLEVVTVSLPGDYNNDGFVGAADYVLWRNTLGKNVLPQAGADGNGNGMVDEEDYDLWKNNYGNSSSGSGAGSALAQSATPVVNARSATHSGLIQRHGVFAPPLKPAPIHVVGSPEVRSPTDPAPAERPVAETDVRTLAETLSSPLATFSLQRRPTSHARPSALDASSPTAETVDDHLQLAFALLDAQLATSGEYSELVLEHADDDTDVHHSLALTSAFESEFDAPWQAWA
jgi:methionine-rich copper-binding protein CopC